MDLTVVKTGRLSSYDGFCSRNKGECDFKKLEVIDLNEHTWHLLNSVNKAVNLEIKFQYDLDLYGYEEFWSYPTNLQGDCEDFALEKRKRLVGHSIPRGALRIIIGWHREKYYAHALLSVETNQGTLILDNETDEIMWWYEKPFMYEKREYLDQLWEYFEQDW